MKIRITRTVRLNSNVLKQVMHELLTISGPMTFQEEKKPLMFQENDFEWDHFFENCTTYRTENGFEPNDFLVVLTELRNNRNYFSFFSETGERTIFIHADDWQNYIYTDAVYPVTYEIIANIMQYFIQENGGVAVQNYTHKDPIGCVNDMCGWKPDITFKLRTADICSDCLTLFSSVLTPEMLTQCVDIFELLRKKMLFNKSVQRPVTFDENLPFSIAITKRKLGTTMEPFRKMLMLIDHFDSIVRTTVLMLGALTKTKEEMAAFLKERHLDRLPSLGSWVDALAAIVRTSRNQFPELELPNDFSFKVEKVVAISNEAKITYIRNEKRGHGYIECHDSGYKKDFNQCIPALESIEQLLAVFFTRFKYYHVINLKRKEDNSFSVMVQDVSGSNPAFLEREVIATFHKIEDIPMEGRLYLVTPNLSKWTDLSPYFQYTDCDLCHSHRVLIFDGIYLLDPYKGHRFERGGEN